MRNERNARNEGDKGERTEGVKRKRSLEAPLDDDGHAIGFCTVEYALLEGCYMGSV